MELVSTMEIAGEEREIADAYARGKIDGINNNLDGLEYGEVAGGKNKVFGVSYGYINSSGNYFIDNDSTSAICYLENGKTYKISCNIKPFAENIRIGKIYSKTPENGTVDNMQQLGKGIDTFTSNFTGYAIVYTHPSKNENVINSIQIEEGTQATEYKPFIPSVKMLAEDVASLKNDLSDCRKKSDITTNETLIGTFNGKNYYRKLFTGISGSGGSVTVNVGEKIEIYNYYGRAYTYGQSGASDVKYPIPNKNYYIDSQNASETSFQLTIPTSSDTRKVDLVIEYTKVDE